jgi:hypothetical protein
MQILALISCCCLFALCACRHTTPEDVLRAYQKQPNNRLLLVQSSHIPLSISNPQQTPIEQATLTIDNQEVLLLQTSDGWRFASGLFGFYGNQTPRQSIRSFLRAIRNQRYDIVYALAPSDVQSATSPEALADALAADQAALLAKAELVEKYLSLPVRVAGETAVLLFEGGGIELVFENGGWRVSNLR